MKRRLLFLLMTILALPGMAQIVSIGTGSTGNYMVPINTFYRHSYTQQIYTATELGSPTGEIRSVAFQYIHQTPQTKENMVIYLGNTTKTNFSSTSDWVPVSSMTEVFSGTVNFSNTNTDNWVVIDFDASFQWDGTSNLVVAVVNNDGNYYTSSNPTFYVHTAGTNTALRYQVDGTTHINPATFTNAGTMQSARNNIQFEFGAPITCPKPTALSFSNMDVSSVDISWVEEGTATEWEIQYKPSTETDWANAYSDFVFSDNTTIIGLNGNTVYHFRVRSICSSDDESSWNIGSFRTACDAISELPWGDSFDSYGTGTTVFPECWTRNTTYTDRPYVNGTNFSPPGSLYFNAASGSYNIAALPPMDESIDVSTLRVNFMYRTTNATDILKIGVMTDPDDETTWTLVEEISNTATGEWFEREVLLASYEGTGKYIALRVDYSTAVTYAYVDDLVVSYIPDCAKPTHITLTDLEANSVEISWVPGNQGDFAWYLHYRELGDSDWDSIYTNDNTYYLDGLTANTTYEYRIKTDCGYELSEPSFVSSFRTLCDPIFDMPWTDDFDSYASGTTSFPPCWIRNTTYNDRPYVNSSQSFSSPNSLYFYAASGSYNIAAMPKVDESIPVNTLRVNFNYRSTNATDILYVGVMTDPNDESTWTMVEAIVNPATATWYSHEVSFGSYEGTGQFIAFKVEYVSAIAYAYVDDVTLSYIPDCAKPTNVSLSNPTANSIDVSWNPGNEGDYAWYLYFKKSSQTSWDSVLVFDNPYTLDNLDANTAYELEMKTDCGIEQSESTNTFFFRTNCNPVTDLPWIENFDTHGTTAGTRPDCWSFPVIHNNFPSIVTLHSTSAPASLKFQSPLGVRTYAITPQMDEDINELRVKFMLKAESITNSGTFEVGVMSDPMDTSTFEVVEIITPATVNFTEYEVGFGGTVISGFGNYIAFRHNTNSAAWFYWLDDVEVSYLPECTRPTQIVIENITTTDADVSWTPGIATDNAWWVYYKLHSSSDWDSVYNVDGELTLTDLIPGSAYEIEIRTDCGNELSEPSLPLMFRTECAPISQLPWFDDFDTYGGASATIFPACWTSMTTYSTYPYLNGTNNSPPASLYFYATAGNYCVAVLPEIDASIDVSSLSANFMLHKAGAAYHITVGVMTDNEDISTFDSLYNLSPDATSSWQMFDIDFADYTGNGQYIAFKVEGFGATNGMRIDDLTIYETPSCNIPTGLVRFSDLTTESTITVDWDDDQDGDVTAWIVEYKPLDDEVYESVTAYNHPYTITNLEPNQVYHIRVAAICTCGDTTFFTPTINAGMPCVTIEDFPYEQGFDGAWYVAHGLNTGTHPWCWTNVNGGGNTTYLWRKTTTAAYVRSGTGAMQMNAGNTANPLSEWMISPVFSLTGNEMIRFWAKGYSTYTDDLNIQILDVSTNGAFSTEADTNLFTVIMPNTIVSPTDWEEYEVSLANYSGDHQIAFVRNTSGGYFLNIDDFVIMEIPDCARPTQVAVTELTDESAEITWIPGNDGDNIWRLYYRKTTENSWDSIDVYDSPYTITGLESNTAYELLMRTDCGTELSEPTNLLTFRTTCEPITDFPWIEDFNSLATGGFPDCWYRPVIYSTYPKASTTAARVHSSPASIEIHSAVGAPTYVISPILGEDINLLRVKFWAMAESITNSGTLEVGVMSNPDDLNTFESVRIIQPEDTDYNQYEVSFATTDLSGENRFIAFRQNTVSASWYYWIDDVEVDYIPDCARPENLEIENLTADAGDITWTPGNEGDYAWYLYIREQGETDWDSTYVVYNPHPLSNLTPNTSYQVMMKTDCGNELSGASAILNFRTHCSPIDEIPWFDNFDTYGTGTSIFPDCWTRNTTYADRPYVTTTNYAGAGSLYFYAGTAGTYNIAAMPMIDESIEVNELRLNFWYRKTNANDTLKIGVMDNPNDASTWTDVSNVFVPATATWYDVEVSLAPYQGTGKFIAFRIDHSGTVAYAYVDEIELSYIPDCARPSNIQGIDITTTSIEIEWTPGNPTDNAWWLYYRESGNTDWDSIYTFDNPHLLSNLQPSTGYEIKLATDCGTELSEESQTVLVRTACDAISALPWVEDFDSYGTGTTVFPECWTKNSTVTDRPYVATTNYAGVGSLYFYAGTAGTYNIAAIPEMDQSIEINELRVRFMYRKTNASDVLKVGVMDDPTDATTWEEVDEVTNLATTVWEEQEVSFAPYEGNGKYIAFKVEHTGSTAYGYIDNVEVSYIPDCARPQNIQTLAAFASSIELSWDPGNIGDNAWWVHYKAATSTDWDSVYTNDNPFTLTNLQSATAYEIRVRTDCGAEVSEISIIHNTSTGCFDGAVTDFPWEEGFESGLMCWTQEHTSGTVDWGTSSTYTDPRTGTGYASFYFASSSADNRTMLVSPVLDITSLVSPYVSFWHTQEKWVNDQDELKVFYRESGSDNWTQLAHYTSDIVVYTLDSVALPNPSSTYQIAFEAKAKFGRGVALDDITVYDADADGCAPPTGLTVTPSNTFATVSWTPTGEELNWEVRLGQNGTPETANNSTHIVDGLTASTNYTVYVRSNCGTGYSNWISASFTTTDAQVAPEVTATVSSAQITQTTAVLTGEYLQGSDLIDSKGFEYKKASETDWEEVEVIGNDNPYTYQATNLVADTDYEVRAYVETNTEGITYSDVVEFTTLAIIPPTVTTDNVQVDNDAKKATFTGTTAQNTEQIIARGFEYKKEADAWSTAVDLTATGSANITATTPTLEEDVSYVVRAYAETNSGKTYGDELDFEIVSGEIIPPVVTTDEAVVNDDATVVFTGTTTENTEAITARGFEYKKETETWSSAEDIVATGTTTITATTPVLENEQRYMVRAYARTVSGKTYGEELNFEVTSSLTTIDINNLDITLYPNPATSTTTISIKGIDGKATISIIDIQGRTITSVEKNSSSNEIKHSFSLENLAKGVYYIRVNAHNGIKTQKLIVQ